MAFRIVVLSLALICQSPCGLAAFVFSPARAPSTSNGLAPEDLRAKGRTLAQELREVLPASSARPKQLEPAVDQSKEDDKEKESRSELLAASSLFNSASSENTEEQQATEDALREAMSSPSQLGQPDRSIQATKGSACLPDFNECPDAWHKEGVLCVASSAYSGQCAVEADLSEMSVEQKIAFASFCSVTFPCQEDCAQDFQQTCPSLWREIGNGICAAPLQYEGECATRVQTGDTSEEAKYTWSIRCGARWPCAAQGKRSYSDVCPKGWSLHLGKVCSAPPSYDGPCEHTAYMSGATDSDKKTFEATCHVEWMETGGECMHDKTAACPLGWYQSGDDCLAPLTYNTCSNRKSFKGMTPAAKGDWAKNCKVEWPCRGRHKCSKTYSAPCPADWYAFNGGMSCAAPNAYSGICESVLHGLFDLTQIEKVSLERKCQFNWPCAGEVYVSVLQVGTDSATPGANGQNDSKAMK